MVNSTLLSSEVAEASVSPLLTPKMEVSILTGEDAKNFIKA